MKMALKIKRLDRFSKKEIQENVSLYLLKKHNDKEYALSANFKLKKCLKLKVIKKAKYLSWLVCFSWLEHHPIYRKVEGLIPNQGTYLCCKFYPCSGHIQSPFQAWMEGNQLVFLSHINISLSLSLSLSVPLHLSLSLSVSNIPSFLSKSNEKCPQMSIKKKKTVLVTICRTLTP